MPPSPDAFRYAYSADTLVADELGPFFAGWPKPPDNERRLEILLAASEVVIARSEEGTVVGFATAITDGAFAAFIPLVEVRADVQHLGIGTALVQRLLQRLDGYYSVDLVCDADISPFYRGLGATELTGMGWRRPDVLETTRPKASDIV